MKIFNEDNLNIDEILSKDEKAKKNYELILPILKECLNACNVIQNENYKAHFIRDFILALAVKVNQDYKIEKRIKK